MGSKAAQRWLGVSPHAADRGLCRSQRTDLSALVAGSPYRRCRSFSDFWEAYAQLGPCHQGKETGELAHIERWFNTLRQRLARYVRKTLSLSEKYHELVTRWFIMQ